MLRMHHPSSQSTLHDEEHCEASISQLQKRPTYKGEGHTSERWWLVPRLQLTCWVPTALALLLGFDAIHALQWPSHMDKAQPRCSTWPSGPTGLIHHSLGHGLNTTYHLGKQLTSCTASSPCPPPQSLGDNHASLKVPSTPIHQLLPNKMVRRQPCDA